MKVPSPSSVWVIAAICITVMKVSEQQCVVKTLLKYLQGQKNMIWDVCHCKFRFFTESASGLIPSIICYVRGMLCAVQSVHIFYKSLITPFYKGPRTELSITMKILTAKWWKEWGLRGSNFVSEMIYNRLT